MLKITGKFSKLPKNAENYRENKKIFENPKNFEKKLYFPQKSYTSRSAGCITYFVARSGKYPVPKSNI